MPASCCRSSAIHNPFRRPFAPSVSGSGANMRKRRTPSPSLPVRHALRRGAELGAGSTTGECVPARGVGAHRCIRRMGDADETRARCHERRPGGPSAAESVMPKSSPVRQTTGFLQRQPARSTVTPVGSSPSAHRDSPTRSGSPLIQTRVGSLAPLGDFLDSDLSATGDEPQTEPTFLDWENGEICASRASVG